MKKVGIVDYGMGNLDSVVRAVEECGGDPIVIATPYAFNSVNSIILPGVGAFATGMQNIRERGLEEALNTQLVSKGIPTLGVCLGMQLLATQGDEGGETRGLGWIEGEVKRLAPNGQDHRIPHVGWNEVLFAQDSLLFKGVPSGKDFYFVHSYYLKCKNREDVIATTPYCGGFASAVGRGNILGVQFHPEKSQRVGFQVIRNFLAL